MGAHESMQVWLLGVGRKRERNLAQSQFLRQLCLCVLLSLLMHCWSQGLETKLLVYTSSDRP